MTRFTPLHTGVSLFALVAAGSAQADVTAQEVWENWKSTMDVYGEGAVTTGAEDYSGGVLTVSDFAVNMSDDLTTMNAEVGDIVFTENGDGTVSITMADSYPIVITEGDGSVTLDVSQSGLSIVASGEPAAINYQLTADQYAIALGEMTGPDNEMVDGDFRITGNGLTGNYTVTTGEMRNINYAAGAESLDILVDITDGDTGEAVLLSGKMNSFSASALAMLPEGMDIEDPETFLGKGASFEGGYGVQDGAFIFEMNVEGEEVTGTASVGSIDVSAALSEDRVDYSAATNSLAMQLNAAELPFPVDISLAQYGIGLNVPLSSTDTAEPFGLAINISELAVNDEIWMMGDPAGQLPRDPITIRLDVSGEGRLFYDLLDPADAEAIANADIPGELNALTLNDLTVQALGAAVDGAGSFTFDNSDLETFDGLPRPEGQITVNIAGANKLIDTLVAMGLVPEQEAGMGRMMMGMFARTVGDDELTSTIEVNSEGHVLANGQRIR